MYRCWSHSCLTFASLLSSNKGYFSSPSRPPCLFKYHVLLTATEFYLVLFLQLSLHSLNFPNSLISLAIQAVFSAVSSVLLKPHVLWTSHDFSALPISLPIPTTTNPASLFFQTMNACNLLRSPFFTMHETYVFWDVKYMDYQLKLQK